MRRFKGLVLAAVLAAAVQGCSTLPDDEDMTGVDVVDIIRNVRCELKAAVSRYPAGHVIHTWSIAYAFTFTSTEANLVGGAAALVFPISNGSFRIGFDAAKNRERRGEKEISMAEKLSNLRGLDCAQASPAASHRYPILGKVGLDEVVTRLAIMLEEKGLTFEDFSQELLFTLRVGGGIHPSVSIVPAAGHLRNFSLDASASREDKHKLLVAFSAPPRQPRATRVEIVNFKDLDLQVAPQPGTPSQRPSGVSPQGAPSSVPAPAPAVRSTAPAAAPPADRGNLEALRKLNNIRTRNIQEDILDEVER